MLRWSFLAFALGASGCAGYRPEPLTRPAAAAPERALDVPRLRADLAQLGRRAPIRIDLSDGLDPDEAALLAVLLDPDLVAAREQQGEARAQIVAAGILPNPVLGVEYDHPYASGSAGTSEVLNLSLSLELKPILSRSAQQSAAEAGVAQVDLGIAWQEWQIAQQARLLVVRLEWLHKRIQLAREELTFEEQTAHVLEQVGASGDATLGQIGVQRAALEGVRNAVDDLEQTQLDSGSELRALLGNPPVSELGVPEPGPVAPAAVPAILDCLPQRLDLQALERGYQAQEASVRAAVIQQFPELTLGIVHQHNEASLNFVGAFVNVGLPIFDRNQGRIALARATRQRLKSEYQARVASVRADLERLARFSSLVERQLPRVHAAIAPLEQIERKQASAVLRGDLDRLAYQTVRTALFEQRLREAALSQALVEAQLGLEAACGAAR